MPPKPKKPCNKSGCPNLTTERYCEQHKVEVNHYDKYRGSAASRGYNRKWDASRKRFLLGNPLCVRCQDEGWLEEATVVDHIIPHKGDKKLFWDRNNWQSLCKKHHDRKTATEDGGFGR